MRGRENVQKRYFVHVAGYNLGLVMRQLIGAGTPKQLAARSAWLLWLLDPDVGLPVILILPPERPAKAHFLNGLLRLAELLGYGPLAWDEQRISWGHPLHRVRVRRRPPCVRGEAREDRPCDWSCNGL